MSGRFWPPQPKAAYGYAAALWFFMENVMNEEMILEKLACVKEKIFQKSLFDTLMIVLSFLSMSIVCRRTSLIKISMAYTISKAYGYLL
jgi:hypothetical protein